MWTFDTCERTFSQFGECHGLGFGAEGCDWGCRCFSGKTERQIHFSRWRDFRLRLADCRWRGGRGRFDCSSRGNEARPRFALRSLSLLTSATRRNRLALLCLGQRGERFGRYWHIAYPLRFQVFEVLNRGIEQLFVSRRHEAQSSCTNHFCQLLFCVVLVNTSHAKMLHTVGRASRR